MSSFKNVHEFDGKIEPEYKKTLVRGRISDVEKTRMFKDLSNIVSEGAKPYLKMIMENIQQYANHEVGNDLYADDILAEICVYLENTKEKTILQLLDEQLAEISSGTCPSGRTTRLWQIYVAVRDAEKNEVKELKKTLKMLDSSGREIEIEW